MLELAVQLKTNNYNYIIIMHAPGSMLLSSCHTVYTLTSLKLFSELGVLGGH